MSSESTDWITVSSGKDPLGDQMDLMIWRTKCKDPDVAGSPRGNISHSADLCNSVQVSLKKRRAGDDGKMPQKRMRCINLSNSTEHNKVSVEDFRIRRGKRKARGDATPPAKKTRCSANTKTNDPNVDLVINCQLGSRKRMADNDGEAPKKRGRGGFTESNATKFSVDLKEDKSATNNADEISQEERIYAMSSSGNKSRADFKRKYKQCIQIGAGGFGSVYGGYRRADLLPVAIKHVPSKVVKRERVICNGKVYNIISEVAFMLKTAGLPGSVGQSAVVPLLDWYILDQELILVMERPQQSQDLLTFRVKRGPLEECTAKMILKQLVDAAIHMHSKGVFHRDIKLQNVLVQGNYCQPRVRVIDFGCSVFSKDMPYFSYSGTFRYAPPEWFRSRIYWARRTTVWQLGVLFYSLFGGHEPFKTKAFIKKDIRINPALSTEVKTLLGMCLATDPKERATLEELQLCLAS